MSNMWILTVIVSTIFFVVLVLIVDNIHYKKTKANVIDTSEQYKYLMKLSQNINSEKMNSVYTYRRCLNSKAQLERLKVEIQMMNVVEEEEELPELIEKTYINQKKLQEYEKAIQLMPPLRQPEKGLYNKIEKELVGQLQENLRPIIPTFEFIFFYISPKGRNQYIRKYSYSAEQLQQFYRNREEITRNKQTIQYERSIMTDSLRYDIMKRDGFRCVLCGATSADGVKLHIDHIRPVSKGGKTEPSNLRTLCERCNLGKKAKYDENGLN